MHHTMGGIKVNVKNQALAEDGSVSRPLCGGRSHRRLHGSNRLGGNAISESSRPAATPTNLLAE
ncbi:MAG: hypothetical protein ACLUI3_14705 [Christensenellales bacterium]